MADIVRNNEQVQLKKGKEVELDKVKEKPSKGVEVTIDNYNRVQLNLLNAINANMITIIKVLKDIKDKR